MYHVLITCVVCLQFISIRLCDIADDTTKPNVGDSNLPLRTTTTTLSASNAANDVFTISIIIGIITTILMVLIATVVIALILFRRKSIQQKSNTNGLYSTLSRKNAQQMQPQSLHTPAELYNQIKLSPSTGQTEFNSIPESESINNNPPPPPYDIHPSVNTDKPNSAIPQTTVTAASNLSPHDAEESTSEQPTYAVVDKKEKRKKEIKGKESVQSQDTAAEQEGDPVPHYDLKASDQNAVEQRNQPKQRQGSHEDVYAVVKKSKKSKPNAKETTTPIPHIHAVDSPEEVYTAVNKKPKGSAAEDGEEAPPLPPHTLEKLHTAVKKKPKDGVAEDEEEAPPLPPHTCS